MRPSEWRISDSARFKYVVQDYYEQRIMVQATHEKGLERNVVVLGISSMVATFGAYTWVSFLPLYYSRNFNASAPDVGLIYTAWLLAIGVGAAPAGALADIYGRKIVVTMAGLISSVGVFILAFSHIFILSAVAFPITGVGTSFLSISNVMVAESVDPKKRGSAFGKFQMLTYILPSLSPVIGGIALFNSSSNYFPLFLIGGSLVLVATLIRAAFTRETLRISENDGQSETQLRKTSYFRNIARVFNNRVLLTLMLVYSFYNLIIDQGSYILPLYGQNQLGLNYELLGYMFGIIALISALTRLPFGKLSDEIGMRTTIIISWIGESSTIFIFVFAPKGDLQVALLGIAVWSVFGVMDGPAVNAWLANATDAKARGISMGSFYSASFLVAVPFASVAGFLYYADPKFPFYVNSLIGVSALVLLLLLTKSKTEESKLESSTS
jgi:MFS transporter, DHA1 family, multidrug resistance protein